MWNTPLCETAVAANCDAREEVRGMLCPLYAQGRSGVY